MESALNFYLFTFFNTQSVSVVRVKDGQVIATLTGNGLSGPQPSTVSAFWLPIHQEAMCRSGMQPISRRSAACWLEEVQACLVLAVMASTSGLPSPAYRRSLGCDVAGGSQRPVSLFTRFGGSSNCLLVTSRPGIPSCLAKNAKPSPVVVKSEEDRQKPWSASRDLTYAGRHERVWTIRNRRKLSA